MFEVPLRSVSYQRESAYTRDRILDAAEQVVADEGAAHLTLDAVVQQAGISKGGLLYHFRSKEALLAAMLDRHCDLIDSELDAAIRQRGDTLEAHVLAHMDVFLSFAKRRRAIGTALLAAMAADPALMQRPRKLQARMIADVSGLPGDADLAVLAVYAINGITLSSLLGLDVLDHPQRERLLQKLRELAVQSTRTRPGAKARS